MWIIISSRISVLHLGILDVGYGIYMGKEFKSVSSAWGKFWKRTVIPKTFDRLTFRYLAK